jgi:hypothetical protein
MHQPSNDLSHSIKVTFRTPGNELDIRRIKVQNSVDYQELVEILQQMFQLESTKDLSIRYRDNEFDLCNITNDLELNESFLSKKGEILKLELTSGTPREFDLGNTGVEETLVVNKSSDLKSEPCHSSQEIRVAITDAFNRFVETIAQNFEKNSEMIKGAVPNPKAILEQLKPIFESFLNNPSDSVKKPFRSLVNDLDVWLAEFDLWMHQKPSQEGTEPTTQSSDQPTAESILRPFKEFFEKFMNETKSFLQNLDEWLAGIDLWMNQKSCQEEDADPEPTHEESEQPFTDSIIRPFKDLYEKVISEVENDPTTEVEEFQLFEQQKQELRKMGFLDDDQNMAILIQQKGDLLSTVIVLLDAEAT